jgi:hypothetical protein
VTESTPDSLIPYDDIVQEALRGVVKAVLAQVIADGALPGGHHFYVAFRTRAAGVQLPQHLLERYPDEMTIVIQHRYWDLAVTDDHFTIGLSFNQMPAQLVVPWAAITGFVDPAVNFALQFTASADEPPPPEPEPPAPEPEGSNVVTLDRFRRK